MRHPFSILWIAAACCLPLPATASIFNLDDDKLDTVEAPPAVLPEPPPASAPARLPPAPKPLPVAPTRVSPAKAPPAPPPPPQEKLPPSPYAAHFSFYVAARTAHLRGDIKGAFIGYSRLTRTAKKAKQEESPFFQAAMFHREQCRLTGDASDKAHAMAGLKAFCSDYPTGPYCGDALLMLAQERLDANDRSAAAPWLEKAEAWIKAARASDVDAAKVLLGDLFPKVRPSESRWTDDRDCFGNRQCVALSSNWLVNARICTWHLDALESVQAQNAGLIAMLKGDSAKAQACWERVAKLEARLRPADPAAATLGGLPAGREATLATRLAFAGQSGRLLAYSGEERLLDAMPSVKERVLYAEYLYLCENFQQAEYELKEVLAVDEKVKGPALARLKALEEAYKKNKSGVTLVEKVRVPGLPDAARDYVLVDLALIQHRMGKAREALASLESVMDRVSNTSVDRRTVIAYGNLARMAGTTDQQKQATQWEAQLMASPMRDRWNRLAHLHHAFRQEEAGRQEDALKTLAWFTPADGNYYAYAQSKKPKARTK